MKRISTCLLGCLLALPAAGFTHTPPRIWVEYDTAGMIGDAMKLNLRCESTNPENVNFPFLQGQISTDLSLIPTDSLRVDTSFDAGGLKTKTVSYLFSSYREGRYTMPSFCFEYPAGDSLLTYCTDTGTVHFYAPEVDTTASIKGIAPAFNVSKKELVKEYWAKYDICLWIVLAAALACVAIACICRKWKRKEPLFMPRKTAVPPVVRALASLKQLKEKQLWQNNLIKDYYTELTDILRIYLSEAMGIPAVEMTNEELRIALKNRFPAKPGEGQKLTDVLDTATLVKFAKVLPGIAEHENCYDIVKDFLESQKKEQDEARAAENANSAGNADAADAAAKPDDAPSPDAGNLHSASNPDTPCGQPNDSTPKGPENQEEKEAPTGK